MNKIIKRIAENKIKSRLFKGKVIIVYGARQVGKTTLVKHILNDFGKEGIYLNCELLSVQNGLADIEAEKLKSYIGGYRLVVLDEAQNITDIGKKLKIIVDTFPNIQIIATGSSSFDLASKVSESLTGRSFTITLYPLSAEEIIENSNKFSLDANVERLLRFGSYPEVFMLPEREATERLNEITSDYLYKDILKLEGIKKSSIIKNLLQLLALQVSGEVSYQELATSLGINRLTVQKYIDILEQNFVVFQLRALSRHPRKEISKSVKIYFTDVGIRNSLVQNYNPINIRDDVGALWENFCVVERIKHNINSEKYVNTYFWRNYEKKEVDYIEESGGAMRGYEFKWGDKKRYIPPKDFTTDYNNEVILVTRNNLEKLFE
jgi:predicted AAA+ superfamily ATPase